jgi:hypothetical protein
MSTHLPPGHNYDGRSKILPRGIVKGNARVDARANSARDLRLKHRLADVLFKGESLRGEFAQQERVPYQDEVAFVLKDAAAHGAAGRFSQTGQRTVADQETRTPVHTTLNGELGVDERAVQARLSVLGIADQVPRDSNETGLNVIYGGMLTLPNTGPEYIPMGSYVQAAVPNPEQVRKIHARAGDLANTLGAGGRVPLIYLPYNPLQCDFYHQPSTARAIDRRYFFEPTERQWVRREEKYKHTGILGDAFANAVEKLVEGLVKMAMVTNIHRNVNLGQDAGALKVAEVRTRTAIVELLRYRGDPNAGANNLEGFPHQAANPADNHPSAYVKKAIDGHVLNEILRGLAFFKLQVEDMVIGRAVFGAMPGMDFDMHLRAYAH